MKWISDSLPAGNNKTQSVYLQLVKKLAKPEKNIINYLDHQNKNKSRVRFSMVLPLIIGFVIIAVPFTVALLPIPVVEIRWTGVVVGSLVFGLVSLIFTQFVTNIILRHRFHRFLNEHISNLKTP